MSKLNDELVSDVKRVSMLELVSRAGYTPIKNGSVYILKEHDSFVIFPKTNSFCHYSQSDGNGYVGGSTIDFCIKYMSMSFKESVEYLQDMSKCSVRADIPSNNIKEEKKDFVLPKKNDNNNRVIAYLCKTRGISVDVVNKFIKDKRLYESKEKHNCVFVTYENGKPVYAFQRGTSTIKAFKQDVTGSDKSKAFPVYNKSNKVLVFEAPIDMMSYMTMYPEDKSNMIALGCLSPKGLYNFLNKYKDVDTVSLILDNDEPADKANGKMVLELNNKGYKIEGNDIYIALRESGVKDVNEYLIKIFIPLMEIIKSSRR